MSENTTQDKVFEKPRTSAKTWTKNALGFTQGFINSFIKNSNKGFNIIGHVLMDAGSVVLSLAILWLGALGVLMNRPSVDLQFVKPHYENWFSQAFDGTTADIETYSARWIDEQRLIEIRAKNIRVRQQGGAVQTIEDVRGRFKIKNNVFAVPEIVSLNIVGGAITLIREQDGRIQLAMGKPETVEKVGPLWQSGKQVSGQGSGQVSGQTSGRSLLAQIEKVAVAKADLYIVDHIDGLDVRLTDLDGVLSAAGESIIVNANGSLVLDDSSIAPFSLNISTNIDRQAYEIDLAINNFVPNQIAPKRGFLAFMGLLEAPVDLDANIKVTAKTGLQALKFNLVAGAGRLKTGSSFKPFSYALILADFNQQNQQITIEALEIESEALNITADGVLNIPGVTAPDFINSPIEFDINIGAARLNPGRKFDGPLSVKPSLATGRFTARTGDVIFDKLRLDFGSFQTNLSAGLRRNGQGELIGVSANGVINGTMSKTQLLGFWPHGFALGARNWIVNSMRAGEITNFKIHAAIDENDMENGFIADDNLNIRYDVNGGEVRYMRKMPWLRQARGTGILRGNSSKFFLTTGVVDGLEVMSGHVNIPKLLPYGGDFTIDMKGSGTVAEMLRVTNFPPFEFARKYGIEPQKFGGAGDVNIHIIRPLLVHFDQSRILYELDGKFTGVNIPVGIGGFALNDGTLSLKADKQAISLSGPIKLGQWQTRLDWKKPLLIANTPAKYTLSGVINRDDLDAFGIGLRRHFGGIIGVLIQGEGDGLKVQQADIIANFKEADLNIGNLWAKPKGVDGRLSARLVLGQNGGGALDNIQLKSAGLHIEGSASIAENFKLETMDFPIAKIDGFIDAQVLAKPTDDGVLSLALSGNYLNIETWVKRAFKTQSGTLAAPVKLTAKLNTISLQDHYQLKNATALFDYSGGSVSHALLQGTIQTGETGEAGEFFAQIKGADTLARREVQVKIPNAGKAALTFLGLDAITGGQLQIDGFLPPSGDKGGLSGHVNLTDFTLARAPVFTQILSLASLQGLADTLGGAGLKFNQLEMNFALKDGVLKIRDGRASGPALGLTGEGDISVAESRLDFSGVLVPSYTVNSILADVPVLGGIVTGKKGEGMFALNYTVKGPFKKTRINVNPLSALTPGFLRRIFDVKREAIDDPDVADLIKEQKLESKNE
ncbi:MAG: hypothetical protein COA91_01880 [Robiginitomaculum sp.]|nr:MAG: hypothetical protein COA91_01880 [Robiginitomaculum sp.]